MRTSKDALFFERGDYACYVVTTRTIESVLSGCLA
jgi:hypothetical protein